MKLCDYLSMIEDETIVGADRILYMYDQRNNQYFVEVLIEDYVDIRPGHHYKWANGEPLIDFSDINVIRAWTVETMINCVMGMAAMIENYGESEV